MLKNENIIYVTQHILIKLADEFYNFIQMYLEFYLIYQKITIFAPPYQVLLTHGVIGNTSDFGSEESRFEPWWVNIKSSFRAAFF